MGPLFVRSQPDPALLNDLRVLDNLLVSEAHHERRRVRDYMLSVQDRLTPNHRKIVTDWMLEVSYSESKKSPLIGIDTGWRLISEIMYDSTMTSI